MENSERLLFTRKEERTSPFSFPFPYTLSSLTSIRTSTHKPSKCVNTLDTLTMQQTQ